MLNSVNLVASCIHVHVNYSELGLVASSKTPSFSTLIEVLMLSTAALR